MALIEDIFKGNLATGLMVGVGAAILGPTIIQTVRQLLRPAAKAAIKGTMVFYGETLSEIGEMASDLLAEATAELDQTPRIAREKGADGATAG
ncbi:MAG: hypothetical protein WA633_07505 [Stellaceae bacterium]